MEHDNYKDLNGTAICEALTSLFAQQHESYKKYASPIRELFLNGKRVTNAELTFEATVSSDAQDYSLIEITVEDQQIASRVLVIGQVETKDGMVTSITGGINTDPNYEGNGLATALLESTDDFVRKSLLALKVPAHQTAIYVVTDRAKGQVQKRHNWTGNQMERLGFSHNLDAARDLLTKLHLEIEDSELGKIYYKVYQHGAETTDDTSI